MDLMHQCIYLKEPDIEPPESESVALLIMITRAKTKGCMIYEMFVRFSLKYGCITILIYQGRGGVGTIKICVLLCVLEQQE
jgi:hypothetical protein